MSFPRTDSLRFHSTADEGSRSIVVEQTALSPYTQSRPKRSNEAKRKKRQEERVPAGTVSARKKRAGWRVSIVSQVLTSRAFLSMQLRHDLQCTLPLSERFS